MDIDAIVVGAGAVGLATGFALATQGHEVIVIDRAMGIGSGVSSRNSEVIHAGLYYPTGSLKARLCVEGRRQLYDFLDTHHVPYAKCGKLVVATHTDEEPRLDKILHQARTNDVEAMAPLTGDQARALEPNLSTTTAALLSPESGLFDSHSYMLALRGRIEDAGGQVVLGTPFIGATPLPEGGFTVRFGDEGESLTARRLIIAASLGAQKAAEAIEGYPRADIPPLFFGKGLYFSLQGKAPFERLIYPLPIPGALGTHYRRDRSGRAIFGPDLRFVDEENYDVEEDRIESFYETIRRFWPDISEGSLISDYAGIRPKIHAEGATQPDYRIDGPDRHGLPGLVTMFGIESPGLTASLAIGQEAVKRLGG